MNREELLKALGLSDQEFRELLDKFNVFLSSLDKNQQAVVRRSLPTIGQALHALKPDVTAADLEEFFRSDDDQDIPVTVLFWRQAP
jgi:division protein CdvB (Snf7/Vps24/ESCRT-III family)